MPPFPGDTDLERAVDDLAAGLPDPLVPLARVAYNYRWAWAPGGPAVFAGVDPDRWDRVRYNPIRLLADAPKAVLGRAAADIDLTFRAARLAEVCEAEQNRPWRTDVAASEHPIAFFCAEYGVHASLPIYSGGLGVLAGDVCKQASDLAVPLVAVGLMYRTGYFHQRVDLSGYQHEYWLETDPERLPCARVTGQDGEPVTVSVPIDGEDVAAQVWRVSIGRVPLYLLDADMATNSLVGRWVTSRLYEGNRAVRLAQYAMLGIGGARALRTMGIEPSVYHLNEGHPAFAALDLVAEQVAAGSSLEEAAASARRRVVFTTHTPIPAGNETYGRDEMLQMLGSAADLAGDREWFLARGRVRPEDASEPFGMTVVAIRSARSTNAVSRRHGEVTRQMWRPLAAPGQDPQITYVTNGVHAPTWVAPPMRALLDRHLGRGWELGEQHAWDAVDAIPDAELWAARCEQRAGLVALVQRQSVSDRLRRGEDLSYAEAAAHGLSPDRLTVGFARRIAAYKRLHLISMEPERAVALLGGAEPMQFVFAGKAHPNDEEAKRMVQDVFHLKGAAGVANRVAFVEDYDLSLAAELVAGCDLWVNLPRPPQEASGTSGMKSCMNGGLQLSVLDGWWAEAYQGDNGWAIEGSVSEDSEGQDRSHARCLFDLLERDVSTLFNDRGPDGIPTAWIAMIKRSMRTNCARFSAARMLDEYAERIWS